MHHDGVAGGQRRDPGAALAGEGCSSRSDFDVAGHLFDVSDTDQNGSLSPQEYADAGLERYGVPFEEYDADGDGEASRAEYLDLFDRIHLPEGALES